METVLDQRDRVPLRRRRHIVRRVVRHVGLEGRDQRVAAVRGDQQGVEFEPRRVVRHSKIDTEPLCALLDALSVLGAGRHEACLRVRARETVDRRREAAVHPELDDGVGGGEEVVSHGSHLAAKWPTISIHLAGAFGMAATACHVRKRARSSGVACSRILSIVRFQSIVLAGALRVMSSRALS